MSRGCVFCGATPMSREHVLPNWARDVLADLDPAPAGYDVAYDSTTAAGHGPPRLCTVTSPELVLKVVCEPCNNGWMSTVEARTIPVVEPLMRGREVSLSVADQLTVAVWACKIGLLMESWEPDQAVSDQAAFDAVRDGRPPDYHQVRLGYRPAISGTPFWMTASSFFAAPVGTTLATDATTPNSFACTMVMGHLVFCSWGGPGMDQPQRLQDGPARFPLMAWPPTTPSISWPPRHPTLVSNDALAAFHYDVHGRVLNTEFDRPDAGQLLSNP